jgi:anti-sigma factor RsiW
VLTCYLHRRRLGALLDGALDEPGARATSRHVERCPRCTAEVESLRRLGSLLRGMPRPADPDWTGFWPGVVRGIQDARPTPASASRRAWLRPRWAYGGALAAALLVTLTVWQLMPSPPELEDPVIVRSADTDNPGSSVMVYSTPAKDLTVVWVFGLEGEGR